MVHYKKYALQHNPCRPKEAYWVFVDHCFPSQLLLFYRFVCLMPPRTRYTTFNSYVSAPFSFLLFLYIILYIVLPLFVFFLFSFPRLCVRFVGPLIVSLIWRSAPMAVGWWSLLWMRRYKEVGVLASCTLYLFMLLSAYRSADLSIYLQGRRRGWCF